MHHLFRIFDAYKGEFHTVTTTVTDENGNQIEKADYDYYVYNFPESSDVDQAYKDMLIEYDNNL